MTAKELQQLPLDELRRRFLGSTSGSLPRGGLAALRADERQGARALAERIARSGREAQAEGRRLARLLVFEQSLWSRGINLIAGVDEAGMAPLAGPVVAAAAILPPGVQGLVSINDSKLLLPEEREDLVPRIKSVSVAWAIGIASEAEIDRLNIYHAGLLAMHRAVTGLSVSPQHLLVDARKVPDISMPQQGIVKGDTKSMSIAAASILAKTYRDQVMRNLDVKHPGYGFAQHKGYPTPEHLAALSRLGACDVHRRSFGPVREAPRLDGIQPDFTFENQFGEATPNGTALHSSS